MISVAEIFGNGMIFKETKKLKSGEKHQIRKK
mgnify:CR=1 FL=1